MSLRLGLFYPNALTIHVMSREVISHNPNILDFETHREIATTAEAVGFDYMFMAEAWGPLGPKARAAEVQDPIILSPMLAMHLLACTTRIRCITTVHTSWFHPLLVARMGGALDAMSGGRWGINLVSGSGFAEGLAADLFDGLDHDKRYEHACEAVEVMIQAWSRDTIDFQGKHFRVKGQLVGPRPVQQPHPLLVSAGASDAGRAFAGRYADYVFMPGRTPLEEVRSRIADIRRIARDWGRSADAVQLQMHASLVVREDSAEAREFSEWIAANVDPAITAEYLSAVRSNISTYDDVYRSLGELQLRQIGSVAGSRKVHGGADEVADHIERLYREFGCNGIAVTLPIWRAEEIRRFAELVMPRLEAKGIWSHPETRGWSW